MSTLPKWAEDTVHTDVDVTLGFVDRLRILARGRFSVRVVTHTEHVVGRTSANSVFTAPRFISRKPKMDGDDGDRSRSSESRK